jgi:hypothetical protein
MHSKISGTKCCENISNAQWKTALEITVAKPLAKSVSIFSNEHWNAHWDFLLEIRQ